MCIAPSILCETNISYSNFDLERQLAPRMWLTAVIVIDEIWIIFPLAIVLTRHNVKIFNQVNMYFILYTNTSCMTSYIRNIYMVILPWILDCNKIIIKNWCVDWIWNWYNQSNRKWERYLFVTFRQSPVENIILSIRSVPWSLLAPKVIITHNWRN